MGDIHHWPELLVSWQYHSSLSSLNVCACRLIEELMLLANMAVAHRITDTYREQAVLRRHPPPKTRMVDELVSSTRSYIIIG